MNRNSEFRLHGGYFEHVKPSHAHVQVPAMVRGARYDCDCLSSTKIKLTIGMVYVFTDRIRRITF